MAAPNKAPAPVVPGVSFGDLNMYAAGGGLPEGDYVWKDLTVMMYQAQDKAGVKKGAERLGVMITLCSLADPAEERTQFYSMGSKAHLSFAPNEIGKGLVSVLGGPGTTLNSSTNWAILLKSAYDSGLPQGIFTDDVSTLEGMHVHMANVPEPEERKGFAQSTTGEAAMEPRQNATIAVVTEIKDDGKPWEGTGGVPEAPAQAPAPTKVAPKATAKAAPVAAPAETDESEDVQTAAINAMSTVLARHPKGVGKLILRTSSFAEIADKAVANQVINTYFSNDAATNTFLNGLGYKLQGQMVVPA